jgi:hypothetical protein
MPGLACAHIAGSPAFGHLLGVVAGRRPLEVSQSRLPLERALADAREHDPVLLALLVDGRARVPHLRVALDRARRHRRDQCPDDRLGQEHRLVERDEVARQAAAAAAGPRLEEDPLPAAQLDRLGALALRRLQHPALELRHALDQRQQSAEVLGRGRLLVG